MLLSVQDGHAGHYQVPVISIYPTLMVSSVVLQMLICHVHYVCTFGLQGIGYRRLRNLARKIMHHEANCGCMYSAIREFCSFQQLPRALVAVMPLVLWFLPFIIYLWCNRQVRCKEPSFDIKHCAFRWTLFCLLGCRFGNHISKVATLLTF
jgi:hypothetical protein